MTWIPSKEMLRSDPNGALEHVKTHFTKWIGRLARAFHQHKHAPKTAAARARSGQEWFHSGLSPEEEALREERKRRRKDIDWTLHLQDELQQAKGKPKGKGKSGAKSTLRKPRQFHQMSWDEPRWLENLWSGELHRLWEATRAGPIEADPFIVDDE